MGCSLSLFLSRPTPLALLEPIFQLTLLLTDGSHSGSRVRASIFHSRRRRRRRQLASPIVYLRRRTNVTRPVCPINFFPVPVLPRTVKILRPSEPLSASPPSSSPSSSSSSGGGGGRSFLECRSVGSWPPATLTWWKKGKFMGKAKEQVSEPGWIWPRKNLMHCG